MCITSGVSGDIVIMPPPLGEAALSDDARLTSVCLSRTSGVSGEQRGLWRLKLAQVATSHVTRAPLSRSKGKLAGDGSILWRPPAQLVTALWLHILGVCPPPQSLLIVANVFFCFWWRYAATAWILRRVCNRSKQLLFVVLFPFIFWWLYVIMGVY